VEEIWSMDVKSNVIYVARANDVTCMEIEYKPTSVPGETAFVIMGSFPGRGPICIVKDHFVYCTGDDFNMLIKENKSGHKHVAMLEGHTKIINYITHVDNLIYSGGYDGQVKLWDDTALKCVATGTTANQAVFSLAVGDGGIIYAGLAGGNIVQMKKQ